MTSNKKFMIPYQSFDLSTDLSRCSLKEKVNLEPRDSRMVLHQIKWKKVEAPQLIKYNQVQLF